MNQSLHQPQSSIFTLQAALACKDVASFEGWLDRALRQPGLGSNIKLADGLKIQQRWWILPQQMPLENFTYKVGPHHEYEETKEDWDIRIRDLAEKIHNGLVVPPLIIEFKEDRLLLADGNHRCGALMALNIPTYWSAVWFNSAAEYEQYINAR